MTLTIEAVPSMRAESAIGSGCEGLWEVEHSEVQEA